MIEKCNIVAVERGEPTSMFHILIPTRLSGESTKTVGPDYFLIDGETLKIVQRAAAPCKRAIHWVAPNKHCSTCNDTVIDEAEWNRLTGGE